MRPAEIHALGKAGQPPAHPIGTDELRAAAREALDDVTASYLGRTVEYDPGGLLWDGVVRVPRPFLWYRGDFGGKSGVLSFLRRYDAVPAGVRPRLSHREYDWSLKLGSFAGEFEA